MFLALDGVPSTLYRTFPSRVVVVIVSEVGWRASDLSFLLNSPSCFHSAPLHHAGRYPAVSWLCDMVYELMNVGIGRY